MFCNTCGKPMDFIGAAQSWRCAGCDRTQPGPPPGVPMMVGRPGPMSPEQIERRARAEKLVATARVLGWGGVAVMCGGPVVVGAALGSAPLAVAVALVGLGSAIAGAVIGQIGRGIQGRVI